MTITIILAITLAILAVCLIYLAFSYRNLLDKFSELQIKKDKEEATHKLKFETSDLVNSRVQEALDRATFAAVDLIDKNAKNVSREIKRKSIEKLIEEEKGEESAVAAEFEAARAEIEKYKAEEFAKIRNNAKLILDKVLPETIKNGITNEAQEKLILEELENAKRNIF